MPATAAESSDFPAPAPYRPGRWRIGVGIVASLALHVAAVAFLRLPEPRPPIDPRTWLTQVTVRIVPPPEPEPAIQPPPPQQPPAARRHAARTPAVRRPGAAQPPSEARRPPSHAERPGQRRESQLVLQPAAPRAPDPFYPEEKFTADSAKAAARRIAGQLDEPPSDAPNAQVNRNAPKYRATREEVLARQIQNAARPHCKDGIPGGLLAPLLLMMDKKDSGCKW